MKNGDAILYQGGKLVRPKRLPSNLFQFIKRLVKHAVCLVVLPHYKMALISSGSKQRSRISLKLAEWLMLFVKSFQMQSWSTTTAHHLITLPTYHTAALSTDNLAKEYFGDLGMLSYVKAVQRKEIREGIACVKHQNMSVSDMGDAALKAAGEDNTMNQF